MSDVGRSETLRLIVEAARAGWRCPDRDRLSPTYVDQLIERGDIKVEIYAGNWRVIEVLTGEYKSVRTAARPGGKGPPWKVIDANGTRTFGKRVPVGRPTKKQPSAPRLLRSDELR